jgi:hypothetical protein
LIGPVALYPDPLLVVLLPAATRPAEVVLAARFLANGGDPNAIDDQSWSDSVKALAHYPEVVAWTDESLDWTTALGNAFLNQPEDVMNAIQRLRALAQSLGNLQTTAQQIIETDGGDIDILPAYPDEVFVPVYDPAVVYSRAPSFASGPSTRFTSRPIGAWLNRDWDWPNRRIVIWNKENVRPLTWWSQPRGDRLKTTRDLKQWCPSPHGGKYQSKFWAARAHQTGHANISSPHPASPANAAPSSPAGKR